jgi:ligand-binding sensor domain-containing protein/two-component sensor histidine kinase
MLRRTLLLTFTLSLFISVCSGQQYNFRNYSVTEGLAQSQVYAMAEDPRGYVWMGTHGGGLSRFDGQQFRTFTEDDGLVNNFINCIRSDPKGNIWIGTDQGVCWYDGAIFHKIDNAGVDNMIHDILFAHDGTTWIATDDSGIVVLKDNAVVHHYFYNNKLPSNRAWSIFEDKDGTVWVGTEMGLVQFAGSFHKIHYRKEGIPVAGIRAIVRDREGTLWLATYGGGLCRQNKLTGKFDRFTQENGLSNNTAICMISDKAGSVWVGTATGVTRIDGKNVKTYSSREGLCSDVVMSLLEDSWGNNWFGTSGGGACMLDGERFIHFNEKSGEMGTWVYAVHCDRKGHIWFGTSSGGATEYDGKYYTNYFEGAGFTSSKVRCFGEDTSGTIWFGTQGEGAYSFHEGSFTHYDRSDGLSSNYVNAFLTDSLNRQWLATSGGGISVWDPVEKKFTRVGKKNGLISDRILALAIDSSGNIWACSQRDGVFMMQYDSADISVKKHFTEKNGLAGNSVRCATCDRFGNMWFGMAGGGISRFDGTSFRNYSKKDSIASNNIYLLLADRTGNIWVGTEKGLDRIVYDVSGNILSLKHYGKGEGLTGIETSTNAACLDTSTGVWFGTINGASVYHPEFDFVGTEPPKVHLTGMRLFFDPIENTAYGKRDGGYRWFAIPDTLVLPYTQNHLRFEFTGIDLRNPDGVHFRWRLDGFDRKWSPENTERQATYSNLPPGEYTFELQARNSDGYWSDIRRFQFRIEPPVWATWPFRIVAGTAILCLLALLFTWRIRIVKRKNRQQLEKVTLEKHVLELEQKALRLQMNPHFIFNALQSIQGFIARNDSAEARRYLAKFGKLMRFTLDSSRQSYTSVAQEAESLQHYLGLEALCHGNRFTFEILVDPEIDPDATFIPVMMIQPFVENAILHGMLHLEEQKGKIEVRFTREGNSVICEITDNGVGRAKASELEAGFKKDHKSAALAITRERLAQFNEKGKPQSSLKVVDLQDERGVPLGTKVVLHLGNVIFE